MTKQSRYPKIQHVRESACKFAVEEARASIFWTATLTKTDDDQGSLDSSVDAYEGQTFFDGWAYYGNVDNTTWGNVTYLDRANALSKGLTYVNEAGNAVVKVDNTTTLVRNADVVNRDSIRLTSLDAYGMGSLIVMDALHIPYGCSVWPSFWTYGIQEEWPKAGEIDIIEAINGMDHNQIALHTTRGCFKGDTAPQSGQTLETDCSLSRGCIVRESKPGSFGASHLSPALIGSLHKASSRYLVSLPIELNPVVGTVLFLLYNGKKLGPTFHGRYFQLKHFSSQQRQEFIEKRKAAYTAFGASALILNLIPIAGFAFSLTSTVGAALWASKLERAGGQFESKPENERPGGIERDAAKVEL
ncbi:hypothetical protein NMY22_g4883 [Coprinellus aureogranulatus]|nr:hypothetical protein NMY22_g4883 [Coprinellus aureogranulatus]